MEHNSFAMMVALQEAITCPRTKKQGSQVKYSYRTREEILTAFREARKATGAECLLTLAHDLIEVSGFPYIHATAAVTFGDGTAYVADGYAREENGMIRGSQGTGSATSYADKAALAALFALDDGSEDPDVKGSTPEPTKQKPETGKVFTKAQAGNPDWVKWAYACASQGEKIEDALKREGWSADKESILALSSNVEMYKVNNSLR